MVATGNIIGYVHIRFVYLSGLPGIRVGSMSFILFLLFYFSHGADAVKNSVACLPRSHSIVLGPGLGRETNTMNNVEV